MASQFMQSLFPKDGQNRSHIPPMPMWHGVLRVIQAVLAFVVMVLTAYSINQLFNVLGFRFSDYDIINLQGYPFSWFTFAWTITFLTWFFVSTFYFPFAYLDWVHLLLEALAVIFWLVTFGLLVQHSTDYASPGNLGSGVSRTLEARYRRFTNPLFAAAAFAAVNWVLFVVTLVFMGLAVYRHRKGTAGTTTTSTAPPVMAQGTGYPPQQQAVPLQTVQHTQLQELRGEQAPQQQMPMYGYPPNSQNLYGQPVQASGQYVPSPPPQTEGSGYPPPQMQHSPHQQPVQP